MAEGKRKLAAILSADVAGYSRLMGDDEAATVRTLTDYREVFRDHIARHHGRVVDMPGDNLMAEFASPVEAVEAAAEIQRDLARRNRQLAEHRRMDFRIGINLGDVLEKDGALFGDGVNVAARLEGLAAPGGICISETVHQHLEGKLDLDIEDIGEQQVKNIPRPVRAYRVSLEPGASPSAPTPARPGLRPALIAAAAAVVLAVAGVVIWQATQPPAPPSVETTEAEDPALALPSGPSIAVLPFVNMSGDADQDYFADGLTDTLITDLSKLSNLFVIARNSVFTYKGKSVDVRQIGRELGVRYILEGSVQRSGDRLRLNVQLVDTESAGHVWAERYDRPFDDVFAVQDEIADAIVTELNVALLAGEDARIRRSTTANSKAYDYFLRGLAKDFELTEPTNTEARKWYRMALELDPDFAAATVGLGWTYYHDAVSYGNDPDKSSDLTREMGHRAIEQNPKYSGGYSLLSFYYWIREGDFERARGYAEQAVKLTPNSATSVMLYGALLTWTGEPKRGLDLALKGFRLDPHPEGWYYLVLGNAYFVMGDYQKAIEALETLVGLGIDLIFGHLHLTAAYVEVGRLDDAKTQAQEVLRINPDFKVDEYGGFTEDMELLKAIQTRLREAGLK